MMEISAPVIRNFDEIKLSGMSLEMSFANDRTAELWRTFMTLLQSKNARPLLYNIQLYPQDFFRGVDVGRSFQKWACVEAAQEVPTALSTVCKELIIPSGLYACFHYRGSSQRAAEVFSYILGEWIPQSNYRVEYRPFYELLGENYAANDDRSEEEIRIPIVEVK
jgi:AraC family transcriptional regulator